MTIEADIGGRMEAAPEKARAAPGAGGRLLVVLFFVSLCLPFVMYLGPLRLAPYRILLLLAFVPLLAIWLGGRCGGIKASDVCVGLYTLTGSLALVANHGPGEVWQTCGIFVAEAFGSYLLARVVVRTPEAFLAFVKIFVATLAVLTPFVALEATTGHRLLTEFFQGAFATYGVSQMETRWGMIRAQGPFEHPILFGVFASAAFALAFYSLGWRRIFPGLLGAVVSGAATFFSLSLGAFVSIMFQVGLIAYDKVARFVPKRWWMLIAGSTALYVLIDLLSNRGPIVIFINLFSFNSLASWQRIAVFEYASQAVLNNPLIGIGLGSFERPGWVTWSIDNFWLLNAVRYGLPSFLLLVLAFWLVFTRLGRLDLEARPELAAYRKGLLIGLGGVMMAICTVHVWNATYAMLMFLLGAGAWLEDAVRDDARQSSREPSPQPTAQAPLFEPSIAKKSNPRTWI